MLPWYQGSIQDTFIYNNTVYWNPAGSYFAIKVFNIFHGRDINNTNIYNNIIYSESPELVYVDQFTAETTLDYNLYWYAGTGNPKFYWGGTTYTSFNDYQAGSGQDANSLYTDPKLNLPNYLGIGIPTEQFTLLPNSPARNAGAELEEMGLQIDVGSQDFFGNHIPHGAFDIGAHEYSGASQNPKK